MTAAVVLALLVGVWKLTRPRTYASEATFSVQASDQRSAFSGIAAQFGIAVPGQQGEQSSAYYVELVRSRPVLENVAARPLVVGREGGVDTVSVAEVFKVRATDSLVRMDQTVQRLEGAVSTTRSRETGIVTVRVAAPSPVISQQIMQGLLAQLNDFNMRTRQSRAANERRFIEDRLTSARVELQQAERALEGFLQRNRTYRTSPDLSLQYDRLERETNLRQQLFTSLSQNYEQARIDEVRDTPALTVIAQPSRPVRPQARGTVSAVILTFLAVFLAAALAALLGVLLRPRAQTLADDLDEYNQLRGDLRRDLLRPWRLIGFRSSRA